MVFEILELFTHQFTDIEQDLTDFMIINNAAKLKDRLTVGIDIGSTTAKVVVIDDCQVVYEKYSRHFSQVRQKTIEMVQ